MPSSKRQGSYEMFLKYISFRLCLGLVPGIFLGEILSAPIATWVFLLVINLVILTWSYDRHALLFGMMMLCCCMFTGALTISLRKPGINPSHYIHHPHLQQAWKIQVLQELKETTYYRRFHCRVLQTGQRQTTGKLLLKIPGDEHIQLQPGSILRAHLKLSEPPGSLNPYQFDYARHLYLKGILHEAKIQGDVINHTVKKSLGHHRWIMKNKLLLNLEKSGLKGQEFGLLSAMLLGDRNILEESVIDDFRSAGAMHLLAISGLHIGVLLFFLNFLLSPLLRIPYGKHLRLCLILILLWGFALLTGLNPSTVRATCMWSFMAWTLALGRLGQSANTLSLSLLFILLLIDPYLVFQPGIQLSYAAVFAILGIGRTLIPRYRSKWLLLRKAWEYSVVSVSAQLGVLPFILYYFHQFPLHFLLANLLLVPLMTIALCSGILYTVLSLIFLLPTFLTSFLEFILFAMLKVAEIAGDLEQFVLHGISLDGIQFFLVILLAICLISSLHKHSPSQWKILLGLGICLQVYSIGRDIHEAKNPEFWVLHESGKTVLLYLQGDHSRLWTDREPDSLYVLEGFRSNGKLSKLRKDSLEGTYLMRGDQLTLLKNTGKVNTGGGILLLSDSPKVNLVRTLQSAQPRLVIADGSNAAYLLPLWERSCARMGIPFHDTRKNGAINLLP